MTGSYIICSTPRTGSTLLCSLLESTGIAGNPQSYFRREDIQKWAIRLGVVGSENEQIDFTHYAQAVRGAGTTDNGVFAARIMWGSIDDIIAGLTEPADVQRAATDIDHLQRAFGELKFVYILRDDRIAQAVSWMRAEQSKIWHRTKNDAPVHSRSSEYDFKMIDELVNTINNHQLAWETWFRANGVTPITVRYEELDADPTGVTKDLLGQLEIGVPTNHNITSANLRLADDTSHKWIRRYKKDVADQSRI